MVTRLGDSMCRNEHSYLKPGDRERLRDLGPLVLLKGTSNDLRTSKKP